MSNLRGAPSGSWLEGENLDNEQTGLHNLFMYLKFGYGRATAQLSQEIRRGRISREKAVEYARLFDGEIPWQYVEAPLHTVLERIDMSETQLWMAIAKFANPELFEVDATAQTITPKFQVR